MKVTCHVIKDMLPLYSENMLSEDSCKMVEEHIEQCQNCKNDLNDMRTFNEVPVNRDVSPLLKIKSTLRKKKIQTVILSVLFSMIFFIVAFAFLTEPEYIPYNERSVTINEIGNGSVLAQFDDSINGYDIDKYLTDDGYVYHVTTWTNIWNRNIKKSHINNTLLNPNGENVTSVYYYNAGVSEDVLIFGQEIEPDGGVITLPRLNLSYYVIIAAGLAIVSGLVMLINYRNKKVFTFSLKLFFLPVAYLIAHLLIKGFTTTSYAATRDFYVILLIAMPLYSAFLMMWHLTSNYKNNKTLL
ncbi:zf-HC2 domain-containing protein [Halolactibacillus sp. JCM 19043]|uniref:zf-HC2 domain-containing protein n=1 Tax=Halolactibacillus sp. JCM 19043 TaxID=1460638 RepID=UPI00078227C2|nr:zf-HC2 domain-containing protein [Halolactibacillus sp. JCM 19043]